MLKFLIVIGYGLCILSRLNSKAYWITNLVRVQFYFLAQLLFNVLISTLSQKVFFKIGDRYN